MGSQRVWHYWATELNWIEVKISLVAQRVKTSCKGGDLGSVPWLGRSPGEGNGNPLQYSCLENSMDRGAWWATVRGVANSWTWLSNWTELNWTELNCSLPGSSVHGIFQARILEWVSIPFSRGSSQPRDQTRVLVSPALAGGLFTSTATWEAHGSVYLDSKLSAGIRTFLLVCLVSSWTSSYLEHVLLVVNGRSAREEARAWQQV